MAKDWYWEPVITRNTGMRAFGGMICDAHIHDLTLVYDQHTLTVCNCDQGTVGNHIVTALVA